MLPPFNTVVQKLTPEKGKLAFGYWEDDEDSCWSLVEVGNGNNWSPGFLRTQHYKELKKLKREGLNDVNSIVAFFEEHEKDGEEDGEGMMNVTSVKHASL